MMRRVTLRMVVLVLVSVLGAIACVDEPPPHCNADEFATLDATCQSAVRLDVRDRGGERPPNLVDRSRIDYARTVHPALAEVQALHVRATAAVVRTERADLAAVWSTGAVVTLDDELDDVLDAHGVLSAWPIGERAFELVQGDDATDQDRLALLSDLYDAGLDVTEYFDQTFTSAIDTLEPGWEYRFTWRGGDCPLGCTVSHSWRVRILADGVILVDEEGDAYPFEM